MKEIVIEEISRHVSGSLEGDTTLTITGVEQIDCAEKGHLTFIGSRKYIDAWNSSKASAAFVNANLAVEPGEGRALIRVPNADLAIARILELFAPEPPACSVGIHPNATVDPSAELEEGVAVGAGCYVGPRVKIGAGVKLYPNVTVLDDAEIGAGSVLWPGVVVRDRCRVGRLCILHPNATIGADGFGYRPSEDGQGLVKIPQIGIAVLGDAVEIGANSCVDRGKFSATTIGDCTKLDNLVQIGHNCRIGRCCVIASGTGVAGSTTVGDGVMMGGCAAIKDHLTIGAGARIGGGSGVIKDVAPDQSVGGYPAEEQRQILRQWAAVKKLPDLLKELKAKD